MNDEKVRSIVLILSLIAGALIVIVGNHFLRIHDPATMYLLSLVGILAAFLMSGAR